jgi:hypothetical protein
VSAEDSVERERRLKAARGQRNYAANKVEIQARNRARILANPEKARAAQNKSYQKNREARLVSMSKYATTHPDVILRLRLKHKYKMSLEDYERMLKAQGGVCAICYQPNPGGKRLAVDHDHATGRVRGLLCQACNLALGFMRDNAARLNAAAYYLERTAMNSEKVHLNIKVTRFKDDPTAQGVIRPADDSWQLVIDKDGYPHFYIRCRLENGVGMLCLEDMFEPSITIPELMQSTFGGVLPPEDAEVAYKEHMERIARTNRPCPRP